MAEGTTVKISMGDDPNETTLSMTPPREEPASKSEKGVEAASEDKEGGGGSKMVAAPDHTKQFDPTGIMAAYGVGVLILTVVVAAIVSSVHSNDAPNMTPTICEYSELGYQTAIFTAPWEFSSPQWMMGMWVVACFILRRYVFRNLVAWAYPNLPPVKQAKTSNYLIELTMTTVGLTISSAYGYWNLLFNPSEYDNPMSPTKAQDLAIGLQSLFCCFIATYVIEMSFDPQMRLGLILHHWTTIVLSVWGLLMIYCVNYDAKVVRCFFALSLYMSTEQNVFLEMLMYHWPLNWPVVFQASSWYYLISRIGICVASFWTWWDCKDAVWENYIDKPTIVYGLWLFVPSANVILNATQYTTVRSLFGIAKNVKRRCQLVSDKNHVKLALSYVFQQLDFDANGTIDRKEWEKYCLGLRDNALLVYPSEAYGAVFDAMDVDASNAIAFTEFYNFWDPCVMKIPDREQQNIKEWQPEERKGIVRFDLILETYLVKAMLEMESHDPARDRFLEPIHGQLLQQLDDRAEHDQRYLSAYKILSTIQNRTAKSENPLLRQSLDADGHQAVVQDKDQDQQSPRESPDAAAEDSQDRDDSNVQGDKYWQSPTPPDVQVIPEC